MLWVGLITQVVRPGAIDPSVIDAEGDREAIGRVRKRVWGMTAVGYFAVFVLWPVLTVRPCYIARRMFMCCRYSFMWDLIRCLT